MSGTKAGRRGRGRVRVRVRGKEGHAGKQAGLGRVRLLQHRRGVRRVRCVPCPALPCPLQALPRKGPRSGRVRHAVRPCPSRGQAVSVTRSGLVRHAVRPCPSRGQALSVTRSGRVRHAVRPCPSRGQAVSVRPALYRPCLALSSRDSAKYTAASRVAASHAMATSTRRAGHAPPAPRRPVGTPQARPGAPETACAPIISASALCLLSGAEHTGPDPLTRTAQADRLAAR
jgi:hypothetical protein